MVCCYFLLPASDLAVEERDDVCAGGAGGRRWTNLGLWAPLCSGWSGGRSVGLELKGTEREEDSAERKLGC